MDRPLCHNVDIARLRYGNIERIESTRGPDTRADQLLQFRIHHLVAAKRVDVYFDLSVRDAAHFELVILLADLAHNHLLFVALAAHPWID